MPRVLRPRAHTPGPSLITLMWLASPALPVGGFSYSEGLEAAVEHGLVSDVSSAIAWLHDQLHLTLGRSELPVVHHSLLAWRRHDITAAQQLNEWVLMTRESSEMRLQTEQMGRSLGEWLKNSPHAQDPRVQQLRAFQPAPTWPVAFGLAAAMTQATPHDVLLAYAFGWAENMTQAAMKTIPLGQISGQRILQALTETIPSVVAHALTVKDSQRQSFSPMLAILSAQHENQYSRLFRS